MCQMFYTGVQWQVQGVERSVVMTLLQIYCSVLHLKNYEIDQHLVI